MMTLDHSDWAFAAGASALLALSWTKVPLVEAPAQHPHPIIALSQLQEHFVRGDLCTAVGRIRNIGDAPLQAGELVMSLEAALDRRATRVTRLASLSLRGLEPGSARPFALSYACSDLIGSRRYRVVSDGLPVPVRGG